MNSLHNRSIILLLLITVSPLLNLTISLNSYATSPTPSWWSGSCDVGNHSGSHQLSVGAMFNGVIACGPGPMQGGVDQLVNFGQGASQYEWECVELSMRYMYLVYGVVPYQLSNNAKTIVSDYSGSKLEKKTNNGSELPTPGDIIAESTGLYGHTAIVTAVNVSNGSGTVTILQQNVTGNNGIGTINVSGGILGSNVTGWLHAPDTQGPGVESAVYAGSDVLLAGQTLYANQYLLSSDNRFVFILQADGNLVLYGPRYKSLWSSGTSGSGANRLVSQVDGSLVLYTASNVAVWTSETYGILPSNLAMQADGNVVFANPTNGAVWSTGTYQGANSAQAYGSHALAVNAHLDAGYYLRSQDHRYVFVLQTDGNLVLYGPGYHMLWNASTNGATYLVPQLDGNLVLYGYMGALWSSGTSGYSQAHLVLQADGNVVLSNPTNGVLWSTGTSGRI